MATKTIDLLQLCLFFVTTLQYLAFAGTPYCDSQGKKTSDLLYLSNLENVLASLPSKANVTSFNITSKGRGADKAYGMYMCYGYITEQSCINCVQSLTERILSGMDRVKQCVNKTEAVVYEDECQIRYSRQDFQGKLESGNLPFDNVNDHDEKEEFESFVNRTLYKLLEDTAPDPSKRAYRNKESLYALMQCTLDLTPDLCHECLKAAIISLDTAKNLSSIGARDYSRNCYLRYELYPFNGLKNRNRKNWKVLITIMIVIVVVALSVSALCLYVMKKRKQRRKGERRKRIRKDWLPNVVDVEDSDMDPAALGGGADLKNLEFFIGLATVRAATHNFSRLNELGQGGFGSIYKGMMKDGTEIAVKRLANYSEQGTVEFVNEVQLILKLQHKNLVRLLGFSVDGNEKLLVYELMPNGGLDRILFDGKKRSQIDWSRRVNIIKGIAKGIVYLHEESRLQIIHRDLKASNILLDAEMNPKISDFGIARIFAGTECAATGVIIGTYGYMAPEYAMGGFYSVKSDVYSFGVLLIEIITGRRNAATSLLSDLLRLWSEGNVLEVMDPLLVGTCPAEEFFKYAQIGLLCVQKDMSDRPTMSSVLVMLNEETTGSFSELKQPAFSQGKVSNYSHGDVSNVSVNGLTISAMEPRR